MTPTEVPITKLPPGPINADCLFQRFAHDKFLGEPPNLRKPVDGSADLQKNEVLEGFEIAFGEALEKARDWQADSEKSVEQLAWLAQEQRKIEAQLQ